MFQLSRTFRLYNKKLKKTNRVDVRLYDLPYDERKSLEQSGFEFHPYKQLKMHCDDKCSYCHPRESQHGSIRVRRRNDQHRYELLRDDQIT